MSDPWVSVIKMDLHTTWTMSCVYSVVVIQNPSKVPAWLLVTKSLIPDFIIRDPKVQLIMVLYFDIHVVPCNRVGESGMLDYVTLTVYCHRESLGRITVGRG